MSTYSIPLHSKQSLYKKLQDPRYREAFVSSRIAQTVASQIKVMRQEKEMSQKDLARELGTSQNAIYRLENPRYGRPSISTLRKVASFFGVGLVVRFAAFSELVDWTLNISRRSINVPSFEKDLGFVDRKPIAGVADASGQIYEARAAAASPAALGHESSVNLSPPNAAESRAETQQFTGAIPPAMFSAAAIMPIYSHSGRPTRPRGTRRRWASERRTMNA